MIIKDIQAILPVMLQADVPMILWGRHGIGKTSLVRQYAQQNGHAYFALILGQVVDQGDLIGVMTTATDENGNLTSQFAMPKWMSVLVDFCLKNPDKYGILHLDELTETRPDLQALLFTLALEKTIHEHKLPKNLRVVGSANPPNKDYNTYTLKSKALKSRFAHYIVDPMIEETIAYASKAGTHADVIDFMRASPQSIAKKTLEWDVSSMIEPSERTWVDYISRIIHTTNDTDMLRLILPGLIGVPVTLEFLDARKNVRPLPLDAILNDPVTVKKSCEMWHTNSNIAMFHGSMANLTSKISEEGFAASWTDEQAKNIMNFVLQTPPDVAYTMMMTISKLSNLEVLNDTWTALKKHPEIIKKFHTHIHLYKKEEEK